MFITLLILFGLGIFLAVLGRWLVRPLAWKITLMLAGFLLVSTPFFFAAYYLWMMLRI